MPSWNELLQELNATPPQSRGEWLNAKNLQMLRAVGERRGGRNVIFYGSAFLQKPQAPAPFITIQPEDLNGLMSVIYRMDCSKGLSLLLHTPGGLTTAAETFVEYLRSKFSYIEVIVPTFAMSAGTMISLASDLIIMGRQSQLGPIDPQFIMGSRSMSARAIVEQFNVAKREILSDVRAAHVWVPILQTVGPALLQEAQNALAYGEEMVARWLARYMLAARVSAETDGKTIAQHFNDASTHKNHGRRIGRDEARRIGVVVEDLEIDQELQNAVLTAYHLFTIAVEQSMAAKMIYSDTGKMFIKNWGQMPVISPPGPMGLETI